MLTDRSTMGLLRRINGEKDERGSVSRRRARYCSAFSVARMVKCMSKVLYIVWRFFDPVEIVVGLPAF